MGISVKVDGESLAPVVANRSFDLQTYQKLGLDLSRLTDVSESGLLRNLRLAAAHFIVNHGSNEEVVDRKGWKLSDAYDEVREEMRDTRTRYLERVEDLTVEHPAIQSYIERNPDVLANASTERYATSRTVIEEAVAHRKWFDLILVRPNDIAGSAAPWRAVESEHIGIVSTQDVLDVAPQLVEARVAISTILL